MYKLTLPTFSWQIKRLFLLLTVKETAMDIPRNLEARRRISFFSTSLFMNMPSAPKVRNMLAFRSVYLNTFSIFSLDQLWQSFFLTFPNGQSKLARIIAWLRYEKQPSYYCVYISVVSNIFSSVCIITLETHLIIFIFAKKRTSVFFFLFLF